MQSNTCLRYDRNTFEDLPLLELKNINLNRNGTNDKCNCKQILIADDEPFNVIALEGML